MSIPLIITLRAADSKLSFLFCILSSSWHRVPCAITKAEKCVLAGEAEKLEWFPLYIWLSLRVLDILHQRCPWNPQKIIKAAYGWYSKSGWKPVSVHFSPSPFECGKSLLSCGLRLFEWLNKSRRPTEMKLPDNWAFKCPDLIRSSFERQAKNLAHALAAKWVRRSTCCVTDCSSQPVVGEAAVQPPLSVPFSITGFRSVCFICFIPSFESEPSPHRCSGRI